MYTLVQVKAAKEDGGWEQEALIMTASVYASKPWGGSCSTVAQGLFAAARRWTRRRQGRGGQSSRGSAAQTRIHSTRQSREQRSRERRLDQSLGTTSSSSVKSVKIT